MGQPSMSRGTNIPRSPARREPASPPRPATAASPAPRSVPPPRLRDSWRLVAYTALCVLACAAALYVWRLAVEPPRFTDPVERIGKFVAGARFAKLSFTTQRAYMELLDAREDELREAYQAGRIREDDYRRATEFAWFGKHLPRMDKFLTLRPAEQTE